ncbi:ATP-binding protein [Legionella rowbothamii]|uniref:ATP-binding protein n=1 Tax=Legionella rowbothamii TaxID=96229 RepID=UPI001A9430B4|nr:ATP-binding protein [Legionella rowbothamii]
MKAKNFPRQIKSRMEIAMQDTPVVLINGPRQSGKTTLVQEYSLDLPYYTLDDENILNSVKQDPVGFINRIDKAIIDEIQRAPELLRAIKLSVDQNREPGRFLLTGSANLLALPQVGDSLAGRMEILTLFPLSQAEIQCRENHFIKYAINQSWPNQAPSTEESDIISQALTGGYPEMLTRSAPARRNTWAKSYIKAIVERDVKDISSIEKLVEMPRLLEVLAQQSGKLTNFTQIGGQLNLDTKTTQKYVGLLETLFLVQQIRPWHNNTLSRITKTPKIHFIDSGLLASVNRITTESIEVDKTSFGALLETWVYGELLKMSTMEDDPWNIYYYRDKDQFEVDFILENHARKIIGIEVKASHTIINQDFRGLRKLASLAEKDWVSGIVLYNGDRCLSFGDNLWAIPFSLLD